MVKMIDDKYGVFFYLVNEKQKSWSSDHKLKIWIL